MSETVSRDLARNQDGSATARQVSRTHTPAAQEGATRSETRPAGSPLQTHVGSVAVSSGRVGERTSTTQQIGRTPEIPSNIILGEN